MKPIFDGADGPYVLYEENGAVSIVGVDEQGHPYNTTYDVLPKDYSVKVVSHDGTHRFNVKMKPFERNYWKYESPEKLLVISDPHGDIGSFLSVLIGNGVMNENYEWIYGKNGLVIVGDIFDRGVDVLPVLWLTYKLKHEAREAGGALHFVLGNHESRVLCNDLDFAAAKYEELASYFGIEYASLFGSNTELGQWVASINTIEIVGDNLFVHGGLSENFYNGNYDIPYVNEQISSALFLNYAERDKYSDDSEFLFSSSRSYKGGSGPIWYRGMFGYTDVVDHYLTEEVLDGLLKRYDVKRIVVGHTEFSEVSFFRNGKVIGVNVHSQKNRERQASRGILIEDGDIFVIDDKGGRY
ncbi:MAG: metallophosphatase [Bacteroidales bacterium]|nr:metallophosphatase [Bacteroidales bacterium]